MLRRKLNAIAEIVAGQSPPSSTYNYTGEGLPFFQGKADFQEMYPKARMWCTSAKRKEAEPGDILISVRAPVGAVNVCDQRSIIGRGLSAIRPSSDLDRLFLYYFFKANEKQIAAQGTGSTFKAITQKVLKGIEVPVPPLDYQKRIAHLLGKVEGLIARRKQHLQQLDELLKSVFLEMFGDPVSNPKRFPVRKLSEFYIDPKAGTKCGPFGSALKKAELVDSGIPVWNMDNIEPSGRMKLPFRMWVTKAKYEKLASYSVFDGDIVISRAGTVGKMCVARMDGEPALISTNLIRLRLGKELRPLFFVSLMTYLKGRVGRLKTGPDGAFTHMNTGILDTLEFPYPPIELQGQFVALVERVECTKLVYQRSLDELEKLYGALSQRAFKGDLDLSRIPLPPEAPDIPEDETELRAGRQMEPSFLLPAPSESKMLLSADGRKAQILEWLPVWLEHLGSKPFSAYDFLGSVQDRIFDLVEEDPPKLGADEYDELKDWLFKALEKDRLVQVYSDDRNRVELTGTRG